MVVSVRRVFGMNGYAYDARLEDVTSHIIAAAREVHPELGPEFEEVIYQRALAREFPAHEMEVSREVWIDVHHKGEKVGRKRVGFIAGKAGETDGVVVESTARGALEPLDSVQTLSHLKASRFRAGLLLNFAASKLQIRRLVNQGGTLGH